jgi:predicted O-linked N-acetylglucosamine transferase (SPINDLY family)
MELSNFIDKIHQFYSNSHLTLREDFPRIMAEIDSHTPGHIMQLLNLAVNCLEEDEIFCQVGYADTGSIIGALWHNPEAIAYIIDNLSNSEDPEAKLEKLTDDLSSFNLEEQVIYFPQSWAEFSLELRQVAPETRIGVYFNNGICDYRAQLLALLLIKPFLSSRALIIIHNTNYSCIQQAMGDFLISHPQCQLLFDLPTAAENSSTFGNGIGILAWDINQSITYTWSDFADNYCHQPWLQAFSEFNLNFENINKKELVRNLSQEGLALAQSGKFKEAELKYKEILRWDKNQAEVWHNLGLIYYQISAYEAGRDCILQALKLAPFVATYHYNLGLIWEKLSQKEPAIFAYQKAIKLNPNHVDAYNNLGNIYFEDNQIEQAQVIFRECLEKNPDHFGAYFNLILTFNAEGNTQEAIRFATEVCQLFPQEVYPKLKAKLLLPIWYENEEEIIDHRRRFTQGLEQLIEEIKLDTPPQKIKTLQGIERHSNFYLAYQNYNDVELQKKYGQLLTKIMAANYPLWSRQPELKPLGKQEKIKVGYISHFLRDHTVGKLSLGWLKHHHRHQFEVYCYYTDYPLRDKISQGFKIYSDYFRHLPCDLETICQHIINDKLHILVFLELGMEPLIMQIAGLKLAPIQCLTWGHPVTSGLPTIDYFLSSDLMESEQGEQHYSETLVRLPNITFSYAKPELPKAVKNRRQLNVPEGAVIYLSCQSIYKYLPQYDYIFAAIAKFVPQAKFVFIANKKYRTLSQKFNRRLEKAFAKLDLNIADYGIFVPGLSHEHYLSLNFCSDIYLDTLSWSGGNTTLEAIACNLPVVTCPGEFMRTRHSYGILKMLGVEETIAYSEEEYIDIAVRLGLNKQWREDIVEKIKANQHRLYDDLLCVEALEKFYQQVVTNFQ